MISQTQTSSNQYGFYAVPKKLQPKKKYRQSEYEDMYDDNQDINQNDNDFQQIDDRQKVNQKHLQRDYYVDQAPYPQFKPKPRGLDYGVQIQKTDLFDFDLQVTPLLQILVGRSVVSAINQLQQQKQKKQKKQKLEAYQKKRNAQLMVTQRLQAKSKRKKQQSQRRVLQKDIYVKNQKQLAKKVIGRKNAKKSLLGFKNELFNELQQAGYLRSQPYTDLRINYEGWLYDQITTMIRDEANIKNTVYKMVNNEQNDKQDQHKKNIQKQKKRRQQILNERQRIRKQNQQRKQKKRIRKQRIELNGQRQPNSIKFSQLLEKYQQIQSIIKSDTNRSNGFINRNNNSVNTIYISGGLSNYLLAFLNSSLKGSFTSNEIQQILQKILGQSSASIQFFFNEQHLNMIQQVLKQVEQNPNEFMKNKYNKIQKLKEKVSLNISWLEMNKVQIKGHLIDSFVQAILNICLNTINVSLPEGVEQTQLYELTQTDKQRQQIRKKIQLKVTNSQEFNQFSELFRIRFQRKYPEQSQQEKSQQKQQDNQNKLDQWIDIYDGEGWIQHCKKYPQQIYKKGQKPTALTLAPFQKSFIYDQRTLQILKQQLQKIIQVQAGPQLTQYFQELSHLNAKVKQSIPVYDGQIKME